MCDTEPTRLDNMDLHSLSHLKITQSPQTPKHYREPNYLRLRHWESKSPKEHFHLQRKNTETSTAEVPWVKWRECRFPGHKQAALLQNCTHCQIFLHKKLWEHGNKHTLNHLLIYIKPIKYRWFCLHILHQMNNCGLVVLNWTVVSPRWPELKHYSFSSPAPYKIHLLNKFCFVPCSKWLSKQSFSVPIQKMLLCHKMDNSLR